jgi:hypothetical protein
MKNSNDTIGNRTRDNQLLQKTSNLRQYTDARIERDRQDHESPVHVSQRTLQLRGNNFLLNLK